MTHEELLLPRYKVMADYPDSEFQVGEILLQCKDGIRLVSLTRHMYMDWFKIEKYPHLFKKLEWWQNRTIEELESIQFVRVIKYESYWLVGDIVQVSKFVYEEDKPIGFMLTNHFHPCFNVVPVSESEYNAYINKQ